MIFELTPETLAALNIVLNLAYDNILDENFAEEDPELMNQRNEQVAACAALDVFLGTPIDPKQEKYLADQRCPACGDHDVEVREATFSSESCRVKCLFCDATWVDQYTLVGFTDLEEGPEIDFDGPT